MARIFFTSNKAAPHGSHTPETEPALKVNTNTNAAPVELSINGSVPAWAVYVFDTCQKERPKSFDLGPTITVWIRYKPDSVAAPTSVRLMPRLMIIRLGRPLQDGSGDQPGRQLKACYIFPI